MRKRRYVAMYCARLGASGRGFAWAHPERRGRTYARLQDGRWYCPACGARVSVVV